MSFRLRTPLALLALALLGALGAGCGDDALTQIVLVVDTSAYAVPTELDRLTVRVYEPSGDIHVAAADLGAADTAPRTVGVVLERGRPDGYVFEVEGRLTAGGSAVVQRAVVDFVSGETRYLHLTLHALCAGVSCCGVPFGGSCTEVETCMLNGLCGSAVTPLDTSSPHVSALDEVVDVTGSLDGGL